jgi:hypothetical protein
MRYDVPRAFRAPRCSVSNSLGFPREVPLQKQEISTTKARNVSTHNTLFSCSSTENAKEKERHKIMKSIKMKKVQIFGYLNSQTRLPIYNCSIFRV